MIAEHLIHASPFFWAILGVFIVTFIAIIFEHKIKVDKTPTALLGGSIIWSIIMIGVQNGLFDGNVSNEALNHELTRHLGEISKTLIFLICAMMIVETIDGHGGFHVITDRINTVNTYKLFWIISVLSFFFSAALDNLTTTIVMCSLIGKLIYDKKTQWTFALIVVITANAGGAWSPIGDVTTIMLWVAGKVTTWALIKHVFIPSIVCAILPILIVGRNLKGDVIKPTKTRKDVPGDAVTIRERNLIFWLGLSALISVPILKMVAGIEPVLGIMPGLGVVLVVAEFLHKDKDNRGHLQVAGILRRIDMKSILFFLGILLAVGGLETTGHLEMAAQNLDRHIEDPYVKNGVIGVASSVVDNVPLVSGGMGMYPKVPQDDLFWILLAFCAGTGGSLLPIGSAAGVAAMGAMKFDSMWYIKRGTLPAFIGYIAGMLVFWLNWQLLQ
ncbi:MAG: sodium:proton antiporter NhaD [Candidatus Paceibacterota bacterium]